MYVYAVRFWFVQVLTIHQAIELENNAEDLDSPWPDYPHWTVLSSGKYLYLTVLS